MKAVDDYVMKMIHDYEEGYKQAKLNDPNCGVMWMYDESTFFKIMRLLPEELAQKWASSLDGGQDAQ